MHTDCRSLLPDSLWSILELIFETGVSVGISLAISGSCRLGDFFNHLSSCFRLFYASCDVSLGNDPYDPMIVIYYRNTPDLMHFGCF